MHTASYEVLMKPKGCHQTLSARVGSGDETIPHEAWFTVIHSPYIHRVAAGFQNCALLGYKIKLSSIV